MSSEWLKINVDETDAQRRKRIEQELNTLFHAEVIPTPPAPKTVVVTPESSWRRLFGATPQPPAIQQPAAIEEPTVYYARPTLGDVIATGSKKVSAQPPAMVHKMPKSGTSDYLTEGNDAVGMSSTMAVAKATSAARQRTTDWRQLPPCPLKGYELTEDGLVDMAAPEVKKTATSTSWWPLGGASSSTGSSTSAVVDPEALLTLATEATKFRTATKILDDGRFFERQHDRATNGMGRIMPWMTGGGGVLFYANIAHRFSSIPARNSIFFKYLWTTEKGYSQADLQRMAQRFRVPLVLTTSGVMSQLAVGTMLLACAYKFRIPSDMDQISPTGQRTKLLDEQETKAHALSRYLWFVYQNHPAYEAHRKGREMDTRVSF